MAGTYRVAGARAAVGGADLRSLPLSERRKRLQAILPAKSPIVSEALSITGRGCELFELMCSNHLEGIAAKRLTDPYEPRVQWLKVKNPSYSQADGRGDLSNGQRRGARAIGGVAVTAPYNRPANDARERRRGVRPADRLAPDPYQCKTPTRVPFGAD